MGCPYAVWEQRSHELHLFALDHLDALAADSDARLSLISRQPIRLITSRSTIYCKDNKIKYRISASRTINPSSPTGVVQSATDGQSLRESSEQYCYAERQMTHAQVKGIDAGRSPGGSPECRRGHEMWLWYGAWSPRLSLVKVTRPR
jgi:hypothetical protein